MKLEPFFIAALTGSALAATNESVVTVRAPEELKLTPGKTAEAPILVVVRKGFHVQANPAANKFLIPLTLTLEGTESLKVGAPRYPRSARYRLKGTSEDLLVYDGVITVRVPLQSSASAASGLDTLRGSVRYQACDDRSCRPPASVPFELKVRYVPIPAAPREPEPTRVYW